MAGRDGADRENVIDVDGALCLGNCSDRRISRLGKFRLFAIFRVGCMAHAAIAPEQRERK
jgi:hypothetical protein